MMSMDMDVNGESSEAYGEMDDLEQNAFDCESCGICRDVVFDRGVLDCCQHWFCFTCIDNWATITNRCPVCKSEFQRITCTPVYDTTGPIKDDEYSLASGDDDWYVPGESNTISFPSYYIDADAVICLDDGGCKIRGGLVAAEGDSNFDTSIACDSCDIWYHAICVGFNPECTYEESWLCPRCTSTKVKYSTDVILKQNFSGDCRTASFDGVTNDASFSGRVSVSIADDGETAVVVSFVGGHPEISNQSLSEDPLNPKTEQEKPNFNSYSGDIRFDLSHENGADATIPVPGIPNSSCGSYDKSSDFEPTERSLEFSPIHESASTLATSDQDNMSNAHLELAPQASSYSLFHDDMEAENMEEKNALSKRDVAKSTTLPSPFMLDGVQQEGKRGRDSSLLTSTNVELESNHGEGVKNLEKGIEINYPVKKAKLEDMPQEANLRGHSLTSSCHTSEADIVDDMLDRVPQGKSAVPDIMTIVEGRDYGRDPGREQAKPVGRKAGDKSGLRVKKIVRRREEEKESSVLVQKLQKEIREVVQDTGTSISGKDDCFDEKLLTAFRAAMGKPLDVPAKRVDPTLIRTRRSLLQKGKIRENLTKKLYGSSTGRRRSAWHRDWEVEFWKYRCSPGINPEKIEALQSVLELLKKTSNTGSDNSEMVQDKKGNSTNSILSRVYLADASVVPRKDSIKPLSVLSECSPLEKNGPTYSNLLGKNLKAADKDAADVATVKLTSSDSTAKRFGSSILPKEAAIGRENRTAACSSRRQDSQNQQNQSGGVKHDKKKWALEVLARKNASTVSSKDKSEDGDALKGNYPLLAQLPIDMRPVLAASRNNKVPMSVRQAQLYRITEHYLRQANLDVIRKCAGTELAVADAVNVEKEIFERSNSKSVYLNLCSQYVHQHAKPNSQNATSTPTGKTELGNDLLLEESANEQTGVGGRNVEEALRRAGLSDSPPNSPERNDSPVEGHSATGATSSECSQREDPGVKDSPSMNTSEGGLKCIVDVNSQLDKKESLQCNLADGRSVARPDVTNASRALRLETESSDSRARDSSCVLKTEDSPMLSDSDGLKHQSPEKTSLCTDHGKSTCQPPPESDATANNTCAVKTSEAETCKVECAVLSEPSKEPLPGTVCDEASRHLSNSTEMEVAACDLHNSEHANCTLKDSEVVAERKNPSSVADKSDTSNPPSDNKCSGGDKSSTHSTMSTNDSKKAVSNSVNTKLSDASSSIYKKVEVFVKENIRPLCKSGVITVEQYRWAVTKTTDKVMRYHSGAKNANFLIKEGDKVKKLALQYVEAAQHSV